MAAQRKRDLLKTYAVLAVGSEGVTFKLAETFWYRRAVAVFNAAKDSGRWAAVQVKLGERVCVTYRASPEELRAPAASGAGSRPSGRTPLYRTRPIA